IMADQLTRPVWPRWGVGTPPISVKDTALNRRRVHVPMQLNLLNSGDAGRQVVVSFQLDSVDPQAATFQVAWPDGTIENVAVGETVNRTLALTAGPNNVTFREIGGAGTPIISNFYVIDPDLLQLGQPTT